MRGAFYHLKNYHYRLTIINASRSVNVYLRPFALINQKNNLIILSILSYWRLAPRLCQHALATMFPFKGTLKNRYFHQSNDFKPLIVEVCRRRKSHFSKCP